jgi:hypothetical protein
MAVEVKKDIDDSFPDAMLFEDGFFSEYWSKRPKYLPGGAANYAGCYGVAEFLADMTTACPAPYHAARVVNGERIFSALTQQEEIRHAVEDGSVVNIKLDRFWHKPDLPDRWIWMRALFGELCRKACMVYISPSRSEDVDLFLGGPNSTLGAHYDHSHVFNIQLHGERRWVVENEVRIEQRLAASRDANFRQKKLLEMEGARQEIVMRPGDVLYVPAYAVHAVTGVTWSVSLSLGLRAYKEIDYLAGVFEVFTQKRYADYRPVLTVPTGSVDRRAAARLELVQCVRGVFQELDAAMEAAVLAPLRLPETLAPQAARCHSVQDQQRRAAQ